MVEIDTGSKMVELGAGLVTALMSKDLLLKIAGPTADYIGQGFKSYTQKGCENFGKIVLKTANKLGDKIDNLEEGIPPRIFKDIIEEGVYCEDNIVADYYAGILAGSRGNNLNDDRGKPFLSLLKSLSTMQIKSHYIFYHIIKELFNGSDLNLLEVSNLSKLEFYIPDYVYHNAMSFGDVKFYQNNIIAPPIWDLANKHLITFYASGKEEHLNQYLHKHNNNFPAPGFILGPTVLGIELFLWAYGKRELIVNDFLKFENIFELDKEIQIEPKSFALKTLKCERIYNL